MAEVARPIAQRHFRSLSLFSANIPLAKSSDGKAVGAGMKNEFLVPNSEQTSQRAGSRASGEGSREEDAESGPQAVTGGPGWGDS